MLFRSRVPHLMERVAWLNQLPPSFSGCVIGNEVLDAMPVHRVTRCRGDTLEGYVQAGGEPDTFLDLECPPTEQVREAAEQLSLPADDYRTEIQFAARGFVHSLARVIERGVALFFDYGFPRHEYYHPQRTRGTLMCHYRHLAHDNPYFLPGLQDITDRKSTRLNSSHIQKSRMPSSA